MDIGYALHQIFLLAILMAKQNGYNLSINSEENAVALAMSRTDPTTGTRCAPKGLEHSGRGLCWGFVLERSGFPRNITDLR